MNGPVAIFIADLIEPNPKPETRRAESQLDLQYRGPAVPSPSGAKDKEGYSWNKEDWAKNL